MLVYLFSILSVFGQTFVFEKPVEYKKKILTFEEANILTSLYHQEGVHSAITGGRGTEKLSDAANIIELKLASDNGRGIKKIYGLEIGVDAYSSASSDKIDNHVSSASSSDVRFYPSVSLNIENTPKRYSYGFRGAYSQEFDYKSIGGGMHFNISSKDENTEFGIRGNVFFDTYLQIVASEFRNSMPLLDRQRGIIGNAARNSMDLSASLSRVFTPRLQGSITIDFALQQGLLSTPFHRVYLEDGSLVRENLPDRRMKIPASIRLNYFAHDRLVIRSFYRYYRDDWGITAHTIQFETPIKISPLLSITPMYRYYHQKGTRYFAPFEQGALNSSFITSDYDLSTFDSHFWGLGYRTVPIKNIFNLFAISLFEIRAGYYQRNDGLKSGIISLHLQFKGFDK